MNMQICVAHNANSILLMSVYKIKMLNIFLVYIERYVVMICNICSDVTTTTCVARPLSLGSARGRKWSCDFTDVYTQLKALRVGDKQYCRGRRRKI